MEETGLERRGREGEKKKTYEKKKEKDEPHQNEIGRKIMNTVRK